MEITEKVSMAHPDKVADRIAGALVDYCYAMDINNAPKCAFEVLIGHGRCTITGETSVHIPTWFVKDTVRRISKERIRTKYIEVPQDKHLAANQEKEFRCGDNGVFAGYPMPKVHKIATEICQDLYEKAPYDGKIVLELKKDVDNMLVQRTQRRPESRISKRKGKPNRRMDRRNICRYRNHRPQTRIGLLRNHETIGRRNNARKRPVKSRLLRQYLFVLARTTETPRIQSNMFHWRQIRQYKRTIGKI